jgi:hypothetical protein
LSVFPIPATIALVRAADPTSTVPHLDGSRCRAVAIRSASSSTIEPDRQVRARQKRGRPNNTHQFLGNDSNYRDSNYCGVPNFTSPSRLLKKSLVSEVGL